MRARIAYIAFALLTVCTISSTTAQSAPDRRLPGEVMAAAPRVSYPIELEAGQIVTLTTSSSQNFDTVLTLNGADGRQVAENDDVQPGTLQSRITFVAPRRGRYTAVVTGFNGARGAFELTIGLGLDVGLSEVARTLREETVNFSARQRDSRFEVTLAEGDIFVASTFALTEGLDTTLTLLDARGGILAQNDDRGDGTLNSQIVYQASAAGRYSVLASTYGRTGIGNAMISLAIDPEAEAPFNFDTIQGTQIARHEGTINDAQATREYRLNLTAGQTIMALADATGGDLDPVLRLRGADGFPVAANDDRGDGTLNSAIAFTAPRAGAYTLVVERYRQANTSGAFTLVVSSVDRSVVDTLQALVEDAVELSGPELIIETPDFRVHYTLEGEDASTTPYAQSVADTLQSMLTMQVSQIGWAEPIRDADGRYRAYVGQADGSMGYTKGVQMVFDNPNTANVRETAATRTVFMIDNDFAGMGKEAPPESLMRATVTHEFNHVIQFGYDAEEALNWLYESTASWTETTTVGVDQDATDYVATDFAAPQLCWTTNTEGHDYAQWTLLQSLADRYGDGIVVRIWENSVQLDGFETMSRTLSAVGTNIPAALERWRAQNFARAYALAPRFTSAVSLESTINRDGRVTPKGVVEQLGAHYHALGIEGRYTFSLRGDANLELFGLGQRNGEIEVVRLGREGVFDTTGYEYAALMVFNRAVPERPGACNGVGYSINIVGTTAAMGAPEYRFSAANFAPPS